MPQLKGKNKYLMYVKAHDYMKGKITGCYRVEPLKDNHKTTKRKQKTKQGNKAPNKTKEQSARETKEPKMTKTEQKQRY